MFVIRLLTLFFVLVSFQPKAQQYAVTLFKNELELPSTLFKSAGKDSLGFMWFTSDEGLLRYDGKRFLQLNSQPISNYTKRLLLSSSQGFFCSSDKGVHNIHSKPDTATVVNTHIARLDSLHYPKQLFEDSKGRLWISGTRQVLCWSGTTSKLYRFPKQDWPSSFNHAYHLHEDGLGNLVCFSQAGNLFWYDAQNDCFRKEKNGQFDTHINAVCRIANGRFLVGGSNGIRLISWSADRNIRTLENITRKLSVSGIARKDNGLFWVASKSEGLYELKQKETKYALYKSALQPEKNIEGIYATTKGNLWVMGVSGIALISQRPFLPPLSPLDESYIESVLCHQNNNYITDGKRIFVSEKDKPNTCKLLYEIQHDELLLDLAIFNNKLHASSSLGNIFIFSDNQPIQKIKPSPSDNSIFLLFNDKNGNLWYCQDESSGVSRLNRQYKVKHYGAENGIKNRAISLAIDPNGTMLAGAIGAEFLYRYIPSSDAFRAIPVKLPDAQSSYPEIRQMAFDTHNNAWWATDKGLLCLQNGVLQRIPLGKYSQQNLKAIAIDAHNTKWLATPSGLLAVDTAEHYLFRATSGLANNNIPYRCMNIDANGCLWIGTANGLSRLATQQTRQKSLSPIIQSVEVNGQALGKAPSQTKIYSGSHISFNFTAPIYTPHGLNYQIRFAPDKGWQDIENKTQVIKNNLPVGQYTFCVRVKENGFNSWSEMSCFRFEVVPPWYKTKLSYFGFVFSAAALVALAIHLHRKRLQRQKTRFLAEVEARTAKINAQKKELLTQKEELATSNARIIAQHEHLHASLRYAETIQKAILPMKRVLSAHLAYFVMYRPKSIVSGDFYWFAKSDNAYGQKIKFVAVIDCTGHGVPGAIMSMVAYSLLNEIVKVRKIYEPKNILNNLNQGVIKALKQEFNENNDGMDISLMRIEQTSQGTQHVSFAGARGIAHIYRAASQRLSKIASDRRSIGGFHYRDTAYRFNQLELDLHAGDMIYLATDGYKDQNSRIAKRFGNKNFRQLLQQVAPLPLRKQQKALEEAFDDFRSATEQLDDVTLMGIRF